MPKAAAGLTGWAVLQISVTIGLGGADFSFFHVAHLKPNLTVKNKHTEFLLKLTM
jgi:hypothetical protein